jgi:PKD repeat protein
MGKDMNSEFPVTDRIHHTFHPGWIMKCLMHIILLTAIVFCGLIPAGTRADPAGESVSGFIVVTNPPVADFFTNTQSGTAPLVVSFSDLSEGSLPMNYFWEFGDGSTSSDQNPTHIYTGTSKYNVSLTVTNRYGTDKKTIPEFVSVGTIPSASFYAAPTQGTIPLTVKFTGTSGSGITSWHWNFGDGASSSDQNPFHTYTKTGIYTVTLDTMNLYGEGHSTRPRLISTGTIPNIEFFADIRAGDLPLTVKFHDYTSGDPSVWLWHFGDGATSTEKDPVHTYSTVGYYNTTLTAENAFGSHTLTRAHHIRVGNPEMLSTPGQQPVTMPEITAGAKTEGIIGLIREARGTTEKNLPTSGIIPPQFMALAAVLTSMGIVILNILVSNIGMLSQVGAKLAKFFADLFGGHAVEKISAAEIERRGIAARMSKHRYFGLSAMELIIIEAAIIMIALAFVLADRAELSLTTVLIYIAVGAISVILHDFAHRYFATKHGCDADIQFWSLGTIVMFLTAWLYGNAFAQSYRNLVKRPGEDNAREMGIEMVSGPGISIILMLIFLAIIPLGDLWAIAGGVGFMINLITAVYSLMPIETMDGLAIWRWNRAVYLMLFIPLIAFYFFTYMIA